ncbi:MAG: spore coat protein [Oscillospiraceae bacterium]|jgi:spore coat protein CotF
MTLTQKETSFLKDLKNQEQLCVDKYNRYAASACDNQLKALFTQIGQVEQGHLDTINQMLNGTVPSMSSGSGSQKAPASNPTPTYTSNTNNEAKMNDCFLCSDTLATEKHVSDVYNTSIFEFINPAMRDVLNHIQKEEQEHGKQIYDYMAANGMYQ